ncbi:uncharacterized protein A1O5_01525 [Cladophialophora psammophila CBS 110553]|uniref:Uncharacterized protein n=1 Tax=Cladophialophora psammophila CBS 110553 TaxID=1182543 RepID=W9XX65_9EURO|nr:uncharacterized protein A1O5_01525 [Cladophialophora psammophila CBS 110553]EXJ74829.1 hypothetical protein A1O5_01525 [Cladophialophora psammophila CBS 110553]
MRSVASRLVGLFIGASQALQYQLSRNYTGPDFFDQFDFFSDPDPTHGFVKYQDLAGANSTGLAGFASNDVFENVIYLGVDSSNMAPNGRQSTRIQSKDFFNYSLHIADIMHMPGGICGSWPAYWLVGPKWPDDGEIDIMEGISLQPVNKMVLHTKAHLTISNISDPSVANATQMQMRGAFTSLDCSADVPGNPGCAVSGSNNSFGKAFNDNGGGVVATEFAPGWISIWNFARDEVPSDAFSGNPSPGTWRTPDAHFMSANGSSLSEYFSNLSIVINTALCGDWTNEEWSGSGCAALAPTCQDYVANNPQAFKETFWLIRGIQVYQPV